MRILFLSLMTGAFTVQTACAAPNEGANHDVQHDHSAMAEPMTGKGVADLPYARGRVFADLDEYLAYLAQYNGPIDLPWWREIEPGVYRHEIRNPGSSAKPEIATRAELEQRFGFSSAG